MLIFVVSLHHRKSPVRGDGQFPIAASERKKEVYWNMTARTPMSFGVGELLFSPVFRVAPSDLWAWSRDTVLDDRDDRPGFRPQLERPVAGVSVPEALLLSKTLEALARSGNLGGCAVREMSARRVRTFAPTVVGERLNAIATVRYRSCREDGTTFLTLAVEVRCDARKLAEVEVGIEMLPAMPQAA